MTHAAQNRVIKFARATGQSAFACGTEVAHAVIITRCYANHVHVRTCFRLQEAESPDESVDSGAHSLALLLTFPIVIEIVQSQLSDCDCEGG